MRKWAKWCVNHNMRWVLHIVNWTFGLIARIAIGCWTGIIEAIKETIADSNSINQEKAN